MDKQYIKKAIFLTLILLPLLWVLWIVFCNGYKFDVSGLVPTWNDEVVWWGQIASMVEYGSPLGYYGYNGTHAVMGTFSTWGPAPLIPYALFGKIFGWQHHSMVIANIVFLCLALLILIVLTRPNVIQMLWLILLYGCASILVGYSLTSMSEGLRYSFAFIMVGILIWTDRHTRSEEKLTGKEIGLLVLFSFVIIYAVIAFLILALVVPIYCFYLFRKIGKVKKIDRHIWGDYARRILLSVIITLIIAFVVNKLARIIYAPGPSVSRRTVIWSQIAENGLYAGGCYFLNNFFRNMYTISISNLISLSGTNFGILACFFINYLVVLFMHVHKILTGCKKNYYCESLFLLFGFLTGYCALYTGDPNTLSRGINMGYIMALTYLCFAEEKKIKLIVFLLALFGIVSSQRYYNSLLTSRFETAQKKETVLQEQQKLETVIDISPSYSQWENTVACYGGLYYMSLSLPAGCGMNYMIADEEGEIINENAKYAVVWKAYEFSEDLKEELMENDHTLLYEDDYFIVLQNQFVKKGD